MSSKPSFKERRRTPMACMNCRGRKLKCSPTGSENSPCERCVKIGQGQSCKYRPVDQVSASNSHLNHLIQDNRVDLQHVYYVPPPPANQLPPTANQPLPPANQPFPPANQPFPLANQPFPPANWTQSSPRSGGYAPTQPHHLQVQVPLNANPMSPYSQTIPQGSSYHNQQHAQAPGYFAGQFGYPQYFLNQSSPSYLPAPGPYEHRDYHSFCPPNNYGNQMGDSKSTRK